MTSANLSLPLRGRPFNGRRKNWINISIISICMVFGSGIKELYIHLIKRRERQVPKAMAVEHKQTRPKSMLTELRQFVHAGSEAEMYEEALKDLLDEG